MYSIGVAIVSYNTCALLRDCLSSLEGCGLPLRVVVVDNASRDGSAAMVRAEFPLVELLEPGQNLGFAGGTNLALRVLLQEDGRPETGDRRRETGDGRPETGDGRPETGDGRPETGDKETGRQGEEFFSLQPSAFSLQPSAFRLPPSALSPPDYLLLLNPDTVVWDGAIEALANFLTAHPRVGAVGPRLLNPDGTTQPAAFRFPTLSMTALDLFPPGEALPGRLYNSLWHGRYPQERADAPFPIDHPLGACILARREAVEQAGLLDECFFMYAEEVDWCFRIRQAGWAIWQVPAARVTHVGGAATSQVRARMLVALYQSRLRFFRKHYPSGLVHSHKLIICAGMLRATLLCWRDYLRGRIGRDELRARLWAYGQVLQL